MKKYVLIKYFPRCFIMIIFLALFLPGCDRLYNDALREMKEGKYDLALLAQFFLIHDTIPPTVTSIMPDNQASDVARNSGVSAIFSEDIDPATISETSLMVTRDGQTVKGTLRCARNCITFKPSSNLEANANYEITIGTNIKDLAGNNLEDQLTWRFTTGTQEDTEPPVVTMTFPANQTIGAPLNTEISIVFSEIIDPATVTRDNIYLTRNGRKIDVIAAYNDTTIMLRATSPLENDAMYSVIVMTNIEDLAGNMLKEPFIFYFTTMPTVDDTAPGIPIFSLELSSDKRKINVKNICANRARRFIIEWRPWNSYNWSSYDTGTIDSNSHALYTTDTLEAWKKHFVRVRGFNLNGRAGLYSETSEITTGSTFQYGTPILEWTNLHHSGTLYYSDLLLHVNLPDGAVRYFAHVILDKTFYFNNPGGPPPEAIKPIRNGTNAMLIADDVMIYDSYLLWYWKLQQVAGTVNIIFYNDTGESHATGVINISAGTHPGLQ